MRDLTDLFDRQAAWQRARTQLSWTEKLRLAVILRKVALAMQQTARTPCTGGAVAESRSPYGEE